MNMIDKVNLEELFDIGSSKRVFQSEWRDSGIPFYRAREIAKLAADGYVDNELFIDEELYQEYIQKYGKPKTGDIMVTGVGTLGVCYIVKDNDEFYFKDGNILWFRQKAQNKVISEYVVKAFNSKAIKEQIKKNSSGTTVGTFTIQTAKKVELELPSMEEQNKIVSILARIEKIIVKRKEQLNSLDNLIKSRFVEMFGDPVTNPLGWEETTIGDSCYYVKDGPHVSPDYVTSDEGVPFISVRNIINGYIDWSTAKYVSENDYNAFIKKCNPQKGDILYSKGGTTGIAKYVDTDLRFVNWVHLAVLKFDNNLNGVFFENMLNSAFCYEQSQRLTKGIANRDLVLGSMKKIEFYLPPIDLQNQFANFVLHVDKLKVEAQKSLDEMQVLFDSLMQKYFG
jgi:type I restriction enzyme S subunit